jgi:hypothetical protein
MAHRKTLRKLPPTTALVCVAAAIASTLAAPAAASLGLAAGSHETQRLSPGASVSVGASVSIGEPLLGVSTPTLPPLKTPTVEATPPPVKAPTVRAPAPVPPTAPVKAPSVKAPGVSVKAPTVSVATGTTTNANAPSASIKASAGPTPLASARTQSSGVQAAAKAPSVSLRTSSRTAGANAAGGAAAGGTTDAARRDPAAAGQGTLGAGYRQLPPFEASTDRRARARIVKRERALKATVARFRDCMGALPGAERRLLELRSGLGAQEPLSPRAAAARLHLTPARAAGLERLALRELRSAARTGGCGRISQIVAGVSAFVAHGLGGPSAGGPSAGRSEVLGARYGRAPSSPAAVGRGDSAKPLLDSSFLDAGLVLLLLCALIMVGLTLLDELTRRTRGRPLEKYVRGAVGLRYARARGRVHARARR